MSILHQAIESSIARLVQINEVVFLPFADSTGLGTLGVRGLGACSVIIIASGRGAIVAHIGPNIVKSSDPRLYLNLATQKLDELGSLYRQHFAGVSSGELPTLFTPHSAVRRCRQSSSIFSEIGWKH